MSDIRAEALLDRQAALLREDDAGRVWAPRRPEEVDGISSWSVGGHVVDAHRLRAFLGPPLGRSNGIARAYWWERVGGGRGPRWFVLRFDGRPVFADDFATGLKVAAFVEQRLAAMTDATPPAIDRTGMLEVSPESFGALELRIAEHDGAIQVRRLAGFDPDDLNALRYQISLLPLERRVRLEERELSMDQLLDAIVAALGPAELTLRMHAPEVVGEGEARRIRDAMELPDALFYVDGEPEPFAEAEMFDLYEELIYADEMWGDEDE
jgi:hypothetical protein